MCWYDNQMDNLIFYQVVVERFALAFSHKLITDLMGIVQGNGKEGSALLYREGNQ